MKNTVNLEAALMMFDNEVSVNVCSSWLGEAALEQPDGSVRFRGADGRTNTPRVRKATDLVGNLLVEPVLCSCTVGHITACDSRHDIDIDLHTDVLSSSRIREENNSHPCAQRTLHPFCVVSHSCMVAEPVFLELGY